MVNPDLESRDADVEKRERFESALVEVCARHPELSDQIRGSLETPQMGEHHNEGSKMESHISLILETLNAIKNGKFHESIGEDKKTQEAIRDTVVGPDGAVKPEVIDYAFLHDIAKPDCLTLKLEGEKKGVEITMEQWKKIEEAGQPYQMDGKIIKSISYFHQSEGSAGQHGNKGVKMLEGKNIAPEIIAAIGKHEVAYQFAKINTATYEEHFVKPGFTNEQQDFILTAAYTDTMAALSADGKPDLTNFGNLVRSRSNYQLIKEYLDKGVDFKENKLGALKKQDKVLTPQDIESIIPN
jgi:hypothetical protein